MLQTTEKVKEAFKATYNPKEFKLLVLGEEPRINHAFFAIVTNKQILVEFAVADNRIYQASSKGDLLSSEYELRHWITFMRTVESDL